MYDLNTPLWERYLMTIEEASSYFVSERTNSAVLQVNIKTSVL